MNPGPKLIPIPVKAGLATLYQGLDSILRPVNERAKNPRFCPYCGGDARIYNGNRWICPSMMCTVIAMHVANRWS